MVNYLQQPYIRIIQEHLKGKVDNLQIAVGLDGKMESKFQYREKSVKTVISFPEDKSEMVELITQSDLSNNELFALLHPLELLLNEGWFSGF